MANLNAFPYARLALDYEIYYDSAWHSISAYIRDDSGVCAKITHGRADEATRPDPAKCVFLLDNQDGRFSPRNPRSPLYGKIGRNTPFRVSITWNSVKYYRFYGEVSQWPQSWEPGGTDIWVEVEASGISRRINRQSSPVTSPIRRHMDAQTNVVAYWPLEDLPTATDLASALTAGLPLKLRGGRSTIGADATVDGAASMLTLDTGVWRSDIPAYTATGTVTLSWVMSASSAPSSDGTMVTWHTSGSAGTWTVVFLSTGNLELRAYGAPGRILTETLTGAYTGDGLGTGPVDHQSRWTVTLVQSGSNINYAVSRYSLDDPGGVVTTNGTLAGYTLGRIRDVRLNDAVSTLGSVNLGHLAVFKAGITMLSYITPDSAYADEFPDVRIQRICTENGIPLDTETGFAGTDSTRMGAQPVASVAEIIGECQDLGYLVIDDRHSLGWLMLPFEWRYGRFPALDIDYSSLPKDGLRPVEDDQGLVNDMTVTRQGGTSARYQVTDGPLSTQDAPDGVGVYNASVTLNLADDDLPEWWAQWLANFGSTDEPRYPVVKLDLTKDHDQAIIPDMLPDIHSNDRAGMEVGQMIVIRNPPTWLPGGPIEVMINGWTEWLGPYCWTVEFSCSSAEPWRVWVLEDDTGLGIYDDTRRTNVDTAGSVTASTFVVGSTSLSVTTTTGPRWVTPADQAAAFPFDITVSGVVLRVTSISGTGATQTFTVSSTPVNGVSKTIPAGSAVNIRPVHVGV